MQFIVTNMVRTICSFLLLSVVNLVHAQGIRFDTSAAWSQVLQKAKAERKMIFVDCYATWCIPCKQMDAMVYTDSAIGTFYNDRYVSVKWQADTSRRDNALVRSWYKDAALLLRQHKVSAFPTYLFFSPDGAIVHRDMGSKTVEEFLKLGTNTLSPKNQFYSLLRQYKKGNVNNERLPYLVNTLKELGEDKLANEIAGKYIDEYLMKLDENDLFKTEHMEFILYHIPSTKSKAFSVFYRQPEKVDAILGKGMAESVVNYLIAKEEIDPAITKSARVPDWSRLRKKISTRYSVKYADRTIVDAKIRWYAQKNDYTNQIKSHIEKIEKYGLDTLGIRKALLNNMIYELIFFHSDDTVVLNKAISWMRILLQSKPQSPEQLDTYANLLYKTGKTQEAIDTEEEAIRVDSAMALKLNRPTDPQYRQTLATMKLGEPTWVVREQNND